MHVWRLRVGTCEPHIRLNENERIYFSGARVIQPVHGIHAKTIHKTQVTVDLCIRERSRNEETAWLTFTAVLTLPPRFHEVQPAD